MKMIPLLITSFLIISAPLTLAEGHAKKKPINKKPAIKVEKKLTSEEIAENKRFGALPDKHRKALLKLDDMDSRLVNLWVDIVQGDTVVSACETTWGVKARKKAEKDRDKIMKSKPKLMDSFYARYDRVLPKLEKLIKRKQKEVDKLAGLKPIKNDRIIEIRAKELAAIKAEQSLYEDMLDALDEMNEKISGKTRSSNSTPDRLFYIGISTHHNGAFVKKIDQYANIIEAAYDIKDIRADIKILEDRKKDGKNWKPSDEGLLKTTTANLERAGKKIKSISSKEQIKLNKTISKMETGIKRLKMKLDSIPQDSKLRDRYTDKLWPLETELFIEQDTKRILIRLSDWKNL